MKGEETPWKKCIFRIDFYLQLCLNETKDGSFFLNHQSNSISYWFYCTVGKVSI